MTRALTVVGLALLVAACSSAGPAPLYNARAPSPYYGSQPCPSSATSNEGGLPTPTDCIPGGTE